MWGLCTAAIYSFCTLVLRAVKLALRRHSTNGRKLGSVEIEKGHPVTCFLTFSFSTCYCCKFDLFCLTSSQKHVLHLCEQPHLAAFCIFAFISYFCIDCLFVSSLSLKSSLHFSGKFSSTSCGLLLSGLLSGRFSLLLIYKCSMTRCTI